MRSDVQHCFLGHVLLFTLPDEHIYLLFTLFAVHIPKDESSGRSLRRFACRYAVTLWYFDRDERLRARQRGVAQGQSPHAHRRHKNNMLFPLPRYPDAVTVPSPPPCVDV